MMRFSRDARFALAAGIDVAHGTGHATLHTDHLLLGLARKAPHVFGAPESAAAAERRVVDRLQQLAVTPRRSGGSPVRYSDDVKLVLREAERIARARRADETGPEDLLEAIGNIDANADRQVFHAGHAATPASRSEPEAEWQWVNDVFNVQDEVDEPYYQQLSFQIKNAIASGVLIPGSRLPPVRTLSELLDLAPGTVARAYRHLEREGVILTDGPRGSRVAWPGHMTDRGPEQRIDDLIELFRPIVVTAYHLGANSDELISALKITTGSVFGSQVDERGNA